MVNVRNRFRVRKLELVTGLGLEFGLKFGK